MSCSGESVSSTKKIDQNFYRLPVVPANRSSLTADRLAQDMVLKHSTVVRFIEKNLAIPRSKNAKCSFYDVNLSKDDVLDENSLTFVSPCSFKPRLAITGPEQTRNLEESHEPSSVRENSDVISYHTGSSRKEKLLSLESGCKQIAQNRKRLLEGEIKAHHETSMLIEQKNKGMVGIPDTCDDKEKKGSDFLIQVKQ